MDSELKKLIDQCQLNLQEASLNPEHPWRLFTTANTDLAGNPQSRYIVLRGALENPSKVTFFTDQRSTKVPALKRNPRISLCFFDPLSRLQLEIKASAVLHNNNEVTEELWQQTPWHSLKCYYMKESPGEKLEAPFLLKADQMDEKQAYRYFTVIECFSLSWDILVLKNEGNQRASCSFDTSGKVSAATWIAP